MRQKNDEKLDKEGMIAPSVYSFLHGPLNNRFIDVMTPPLTSPGVCRQIVILTYYDSPAQGA